MVGLELPPTWYLPALPGKRSTAFFSSPRSFGSTQSSRGFLTVLPQHSLTMYFSTFCSMFYGFCRWEAGRQNHATGTQKDREKKKTWFLGMVKISITLLTLPKQCYKMTVRRHIVRNRPSYKMIRPAKKHACYKMTWFSVTKCHFLFFQMPLKPGHGSPHFKTEMCTGMCLRHAKKMCNDCGEWEILQLCMPTYLQTLSSATPSS